MLVPYSWLRDFAPIEADPDAVAAALNDLGMVVEGMERIGEGLGDVVVARVLATRAHPGADKVQLVDVDAGNGTQLQIVCGAFNFAAGDLVPLAPVGATLPGEFSIGRRKVRGEWSEGMLCSSRELGLGDDHAGILILRTDAATGTPLVDALGIEADVVYDLDITANRPDAMSVAGVARDLAAKLHLPFTLPEPSVARSGADGSTLTSVAIESPTLCPRFTATVIDGVVITDSPAWVQRRLTMAGMRPINSIVDASNYVMLELGQPTHPYDWEKLPGHGFVVRAARQGEVLETLDGVERRLGDGEDCLICDANGDPVGIGGIMGGASSEISVSTTRVVLEAAYFTPMVIARTSKRIGLRTEASARFERGTDPEGIERSVERFCELIEGTVAPGTVDVSTLPPERPRVRVRTARVNAIMGTALSDEAIRGYLEPIGFAVEPADEPGVQLVTIPSWRPDAEGEIDVIEEVGRHYGYANVARTVPAGARAGGLTRDQQRRRQVRQVLLGLAVDEATNPMLLGPGDHERAGLPGEALQLANPMIREESVLRTSLLPALLRSLAFNAAHRRPLVRFFEIGHVFGLPLDGQVLPDERERVAVALSGADATEAVRVWRTLAHALRLERPRLRATTAPGLHPGRTAVASAAGLDIGFVGEVDPGVVAAHDLEGRVAWLDLEMGALLSAPTRSELSRPISRYPSSDIDLAFVVDDGVPAGDVEATLAEAAGELLESIELFDVYRGAQMGEGKRSLAYRLRFVSPERTLTDADVAEARQRAITAAEQAHGAVLRA
ncbi:MAG TPA: phenylalanine--tRNA ligase subunit beta [Acidimicrobiales bacterium]|nr:phenylalanine--tRNA ligase subunit beta [Acidimicrobiales bacterium]